MKRSTLGIIAAGVASLCLSSCDAFFETNLFKEAGLGQVELPSASELSTMSVSEIEDISDSPEFYDQLADDSSKKAAVSGNLQTQYQTSSDPETIQSAAALYAEIQLKTTDGFDVVNGIFDAVSQMASVDFDAMSSSDITTLVEAALPAGILSDETRFKEAIVALLAAGDAYDALGASIGASGLASGVDATTFVQAAVLAELVDGVGGASDTAKADALWTALQGGASPSYTAPTFDSGTPVYTIITASGIDLSQYGI